jgi:cell wall assembly regulator SMI1
MATKTSLADALRAIDRHVADLPEVARSFRKPASAAKLATCARKLGLKALPADLAAWFRWHDGQTDALAPGLDPESPAMTFMHIDAAIAERARLIREP